MVRKSDTTLRVATYNLGDGPDEDKIKDLNALVKAGAQIIGLEEHGDRDAMTSLWLRSNTGWAKWAGDGRPGAKKVAILYRVDLGNVTSMTTDGLTPRMKLPQGAGPENASPKVSNRIRIRIGGKRVHFIVSHQYASVAKRSEAAALFMAALISVIEGLRGVVISVGDYNQQPTMLEALRLLLPGLAPTGPTHGRRIIDLILVRKADVITAWTMTLSSDHRAVLADIQL